MLRVGIITIQKCNNFGADLQAYALGAKLRSLGFDAENIDYLFYKHPRHDKGSRIWGLVDKRKRSLEKPALPLSTVNRFKELFFPALSLSRTIRHLLKHPRIFAERKRRFRAWEEKWIRCGREYRSVASIYADPPQYDVYMVGSDQVWNPRMGSNILPYFLDFVPKGSKCVSYASSFGVSDLSAPAFLKYREWLKKFSHIGIREARGVELVKRMNLGVEVRHCIDPTMLLTAADWQEASCAVDGKGHGCRAGYLLLYDLIACDATVTLARRIAKDRGIEVVRISDGAYGPGEFIWLFAHADYVVTNSFHGMVFSILHHKPFNAVIPRRMDNASRMTSLLEILGLSNRLVWAESLDEEKCAAGEIAYEPVEARLGELRLEAGDFLKRAVSGEMHIVPRKIIGNRPKSCYAAWNPDNALRAKSTSGGAFTILAAEMIARGGIVYGAAFDADFKHVRHIAAETIEQLEPIRKSKYVWSDPNDAIHSAVRHLRDGREVLFSGCPCQCAAMRSAATDCLENLVTVDFVCHGAPKPEVFMAYASELEKRHGARLTAYEFRNKGRGWNFPGVCYEFDDGKKCSVIPWLDPFFHGFSINAFLRPGCYSCPFATLERVSDITIGDCWRIAASHPQWDDNRGTSLILGNTEAGLGYLNKCGVNRLPGGAYSIELAEKRNAALMQPAARFGFEKRFAEVFGQTNDFAAAASCYMTPKRLLKYWLAYWIKRIGWFYFKRCQ